MRVVRCSHARYVKHQMLCGASVAWAALRAGAGSRHPGYRRMHAPGGTREKRATSICVRLCDGALAQGALRGFDRVHKVGPELLARQSSRPSRACGRDGSAPPPSPDARKARPRYPFHDLSEQSLADVPAHSPRLPSQRQCSISAWCGRFNRAVVLAGRESPPQSSAINLRRFCVWSM